MTDETTLRIERLIDAPVNAVFRAWTPDDTPWSNTTVTVMLEEEDGKTRLLLVHENFPSVEQRDNASGGWPGFIDRIEQLLEGVSK